MQPSIHTVSAKSVARVKERRGRVEVHSKNLSFHTHTHTHTRFLIAVDIRRTNTQALTHTVDSCVVQVVPKGALAAEGAISINAGPVDADTQVL